VFKRLPARDLGTATSLAVAQRQQLGRQIGQIWADLLTRPLRWRAEPHFAQHVTHGITATDLLPTLVEKSTWLLKRCGAPSDLLRSQAQWRDLANEPSRQPTVLCRIDNNPGNFLHRHGSIVLLNDWEQTVPTSHLFAEGCLFALSAGCHFPAIWTGYVELVPEAMQRLDRIRLAAIASLWLQTIWDAGHWLPRPRGAYPPRPPLEWADNVRLALKQRQLYYCPLISMRG
jgi:hypothetical protein